MQPNVQGYQATYQYYVLAPGMQALGQTSVQTECYSGTECSSALQCAARAKYSNYATRYLGTDLPTTWPTSADAL
jgi:hypothetical protein